MINDKISILSGTDILTIGEHSWGQVWVMRFNLKAIAASAGVRERIKMTDEKGKPYYVSKTIYRLSKAREMCQLVNNYITPAQAEQIDEIFKANPKLYNRWRQYVRH